MRLLKVVPGMPQVRSSVWPEAQNKARFRDLTFPTRPPRNAPEDEIVLGCHISPPSLLLDLFTAASKCDRQCLLLPIIDLRHSWSEGSQMIMVPLDPACHLGSKEGPGLREIHEDHSPRRRQPLEAPIEESLRHHREQRVRWRNAGPRESR